MIEIYKDESLGMHKNAKTGPKASGRASAAVGNAGFSSQPYKRNNLKEISSFKGSISPPRSLAHSGRFLQSPISWGCLFTFFLPDIRTSVIFPLPIPDQVSLSPHQLPPTMLGKEGRTWEGKWSCLFKNDFHYDVLDLGLALDAVCWLLWDSVTEHSSEVL